MKEILKHKGLRRQFLLFVGVVIVLILVTRIFILPVAETKVPDSATLSYLVEDPAWLIIIQRLLDSLLVSLIVTLSIALYLQYIEIPEEEKKIDVKEPFQLKALFEKERMQTNFWYYSGGTGRYTRTATIPELSRISGNTNRHIPIKILIIDPDALSVCENYAKYRAGLRSSKKMPDKWTTDYVRHEILSTIAAAVLYSSLNPFLEISIALKNSFSTLRIDISDRSAIITKEDPAEPALVSLKDSFLYRTYVEEIHQTFKEFRKLSITPRFTGEISKLTADDVQNILQSVQLIKPVTLVECQSICEILKKNENPYE